MALAHISPQQLSSAHKGAILPRWNAVTVVCLSVCLGFNWKYVGNNK